MIIQLLKLLGPTLQFVYIVKKQTNWNQRFYYRLLTKASGWQTCRKPDKIKLLHGSRFKQIHVLLLQDKIPQILKNCWLNVIIFSQQ